MKKLLAILCFSSIIFAQSYIWELKQSGSSLGNPIAIDSRNQQIVYYGSNGQVYKSTNSGESFTSFGVSIPNATKIKNIIVQQKDPATLLVAIKGSSSDQIVKTTNSGQSWVVSANSLTFSYFGIPMTPDPKHPDTIYTMSGNNFMVSGDFGSTWRTVSTPTNFGSPCDIEVFPDSSNIILVGDNTTGIFRSSDYGATWQTKFTTSGEIPTIAISRQQGSVCYATRWGGGGGLLRSTDYGNTWAALPYFSGQNMWGVDVANDNPNFVFTAKYSGNIAYISRDGGVTWTQTSINGSNYSIYYVNASNIYAAQSTGFYKLKDIKGERPKIYNVTLHNAGNITIVNWKITRPSDVKSFEILVSKNGVDYSVVKSIDASAKLNLAKNDEYSVRLKETGSVFVTVRANLMDGSTIVSAPEKTNILSENKELRISAFPIPFNPSTKLQFYASTAGLAVIHVYNALGELMVSREFTASSAGEYAFDLNFTDKPSGIYYYQMRFTQAGQKPQFESGKLLLQK
ncbi:MAG: hypothetical protein HYV28_15185 [Ignavibacteriales bacterium]|nr:hypothetical protein [Ignavibacteriales bacterium]